MGWSNYQHQLVNAGFQPSTVGISGMYKTPPTSNRMRSGHDLDLFIYGDVWRNSIPIGIDASPVFTTNIWENIFFWNVFFLVHRRFFANPRWWVQTPSFRKWGLEYDKQTKNRITCFFQLHLVLVMNRLPLFFVICGKKINPKKPDWILSPQVSTECRVDAWLIRPW